MHFVCIQISMCVFLNKHIIFYLFQITVFNSIHTSMNNIDADCEQIAHDRKKNDFNFGITIPKIHRISTYIYIFQKCKFCRCIYFK